MDRLTRKFHWFVVILFCLSSVTLAAETAEAPPASQYAPIKDLQQQIGFFMKRINKDLGDKEEYGEDQQGRVAKDATTLAAIGLVLANHDTDNPHKKSASMIIKAAASLSEGADDFDASKEQLAQLQAALESKDGGEKVEWGPVANLQYMMQQVPIVNNSLRRGVSGRRFKREADKLAGYSATLAAMAQASMYDTDYCADESDEAKWKKICGDMRDASAAVSKAVREGDQKKAEVQLAKLVETCDACHHAFRD